MKPALLMITGWAHGASSMQPLADRLAADYDVRILTGARTLAARAIPAADYIVTGSMGGLLALELLPACCRKLVLLSSTARFCATDGYPHGTPERVVQRMLLQLKRNPGAVLAEFYRNVHHPHAPFPTRTDCSDDELAAGLDYLMSADLRDQVPALAIPVLLLHGTADRIIPASASEWLQSRLPHGRLRLFENEGHALPAHRLDDVVAEIAGFLKQP